jgi:hypothetical protein
MLPPKGKVGARSGSKPGSKALPAKAGASTAHKAVARLRHEVRHERPMTDWGTKGAKR